MARRLHYLEFCGVANHGDRVLSETLIKQLREIDARTPRPRIDVGLTDRNRISLDHWHLDDDCLIAYGPRGNTRFLIPLPHVVIVEIMD